MFSLDLTHLETWIKSTNNLLPIPKFSSTVLRPIETTLILINHYMVLQSTLSPLADVQTPLICQNVLFVNFMIKTLIAKQQYQFNTIRKYSGTMNTSRLSITFKLFIICIASFSHIKPKSLLIQYEEYFEKRYVCEVVGCKTKVVEFDPSGRNVVE